VATIQRIVKVCVRLLFWFVLIILRHCGKPIALVQQLNDRDNLCVLYFDATAGSLRSLLSCVAACLVIICANLPSVNKLSSFSSSRSTVLIEAYRSLGQLGGCVTR